MAISSETSVGYHFVYVYVIAVQNTSLKSCIRFSKNVEKQNIKLTCYKIT